MKKSLFLTVLLFGLLTSDIFAADEETIAAVTKFMVWFTVILTILVFWLTIVYSEKNDNKGEWLLKPFVWFKDYLVNLAPMENEKDLLLDHDFDGIKELDNRVPPLFNVLFYGTIIFGLIYLVNYHILGSGNIQEEEYLNEIKVAETERNILVKTGVFLNEETVTAKMDVATLDEGKSIYVKNCVSCHANDGGGLVGPNLTDDYWIHGGGIKNVFLVIKNGVPAKGMIAWQTQLSPTQMQAVASYIISLHGTNPANGKPPEGDKYIDQDSLQTKI